LLHHLLFVASTEQIGRTKTALARLNATPFGAPAGVAEAFQIRHALLGDLVLNIHLISDLDAITPHLRRNPVDLLIYDERQSGLDAQEALRRIKDDMAALAELWGPDFLFPMSRVVAILAHENEAQRAFELGRVQVRDVLVAPKNAAHVLRWLARLLTEGGIRRSARAGMALSGGGLEGFLYQVGVLHALGKGVTGRALRTLEAYSGISSGSIGAALMAGNVPTAEVIRALHGKSDVMAPMSGSLLFDVAAGTIGRRLLKTSVTWAGLDPTKWARNIMQAIPTGLFKGEALKNYFKDVMLAYGHDDSFDQLGPELYVGATDQDTFEHVTFGKPPWKSVQVSDALRASCALPPFFTPTQVNGRWFIDGQVTKTCNLELLVERECRLIFIIDPMKPLATLIPGSVDKRGGIFAVLQTIKALVHTRFQQTLMHLTERYPDVDFLVFQPDEECAQLMAGSPMRYRIRTQIVTAAYRHTLRQLRERHAIYSAKLSRFGFELRPPEELMNLERRDGDVLESVA
jgi:predicted acylesterase/phospholipase RssA/CheY-like chemotaxis protein